MNPQTKQTQRWVNAALPELEQRGGRILAKLEDGLPGEQVFLLTAISVPANFGALAFLAFPDSQSAGDTLLLAKPVSVSGHFLDMEYLREPWVEKPKSA